MYCSNLMIQYSYKSQMSLLNKHPFNGPLSGTTQVSRYQKGKPIWILLEQETVSETFL